jgi:glycosyltransferase involved in cell wall biosynthesis
MTRPVRIGLIQPQAEGAGAQEIARLLDRGLQARGYEAHHLFFFRRTKAFDHKANAIFCARERPTTPWSLARMLLSLFGHLRRLQPDVVLCFQHYGCLVGAPIARAAGVRVVIANWNSARELTPAWLQLTDRWLGTIGLFARVVTNSRSVTQDFADYPNAYRRRLMRIDHGFESKTCNIDRAVARAQLNLPRGAVLLGCVARLHPLKNLTLAIKLLAYDVRWHLAIAGQGGEQTGLAALARELGCADRVHFLGELAPDRVAILLSALNVFVFPSLAETFGLAVVEAAHAGVPVVANRLPVLEEVLSPDGEPCVLFADAGNPAAFAAAVRRLLDDTSLAATLSARAVKLATYYSREAMVAAYAALIESEVNGRASVRSSRQPSRQNVT